MNKVRSFFSSSKFAFQVARKIKDINQTFDEIKRNMDSFNFIRVSVPTNVQHKRTLETFAFVADSEVVGRDDDKSEIINKLTRSEDQEILSILPIVGMGGLGKSTLAKLVYNDGLVTKYFDLRIWVHVSTDFQINTILKEITETVTNDTCQFSSLNVIQQNLKEKLKDKRFLLVLDDVWNDNGEKWDQLKESLSIGARGSKIIVTSRNVKVALIMGTLQPYHLECLSKDQCWSILKNKAFGNGQAEETPNMVDIGRDIASKCGGIPLAAKTLGGIMHIKKDEKEWSSIRDSKISDKDGIFSILKLSFDHLPSHLKQCFLYCSIFPKGDYIIKDRLIKQWMALGFLDSSIADTRPIEDIGNDYFNELLWHSFYQDVEKDEFGDIIKFKMHDLVFDLAQSLSRSECAIVRAEGFKNNSSVSSEKKDNFCSVVHLRLYLDRDIQKISEELCKARNLRSLHLVCSRNQPSISRDALDNLFKGVKHLRVLELSNCGIRELPSSIKMLIHLRYLNLRGNPIEALPESITGLYNLWTLDLYACPLKQLPREMRKLVNLRQLRVTKENTSLSQMPIGMGRLSCLNELEAFIVGQKKGQSIKEIQCLSLRNFLSIYNFENVRNRREAEEAKLMEKENLVGLQLLWQNHDLGDYKDDVLEGLQPHPNLKTLSIRNFRCEKFPAWMMSGSISLPHLVKLFLHNCDGCECVPLFGQLPSLKLLCVKGMKKMKRLDTEFYHRDNDSSQATITVTTFPLLEEFSLGEMPSLEEWVEPQASFTSFPCLERISIEDCPKLKIMPSRFPSLKLLKIKSSNGILLSLVREVRSLTKLCIDEVPELKFLPQGLLYNSILQEIDVRRCPNFEAVIELIPIEEGVQILPSSLELLNISHCPSLMSLPDLQGLHSIRKFYFVGNERVTRLPDILHFQTLEFLSIGGFSEELESFPNLEHLQHLASLRTLVITGWSKLLALPEQLQSLTRLEYLGIHGFDRIESLREWLGNLSSLRTLRLKQCNDLMYLPNEQALRCITALYIKGCPRLKDRCAKRRGEEWSKIEHIQYVEIDGEVVIPSSPSLKSG